MWFEGNILTGAETQEHQTQDLAQAARGYKVPGTVPIEDGADLDANKEHHEEI